MKSKKILVLLLTFAMLFTQFEMLVTVSATDSSGEFKVGVAAHPYTDEYRNNLVDIVYYAAEMGSKVIRIDLLKYIGCKWWDKFFALCDAYGIDVIGIVYNVEDAEFFAERYTDQISYMQLENEKDTKSILGDTYTGTSVEHYDQSKIAENAELLISLNNVVKEVAPNMPTMINITWIHYGFIEAVMDVGLKVDAIGLDWYSDMEGVQNQSLGNTLDNLKTKFDLPIWITEANVRQDATGSGDSQMAETINNFIDTCLEKQTADNVLGLCVYELFNEPTQAGSTGEAHYGLVYVDNDKKVGKPKQAYYDIEKHLEGLGLKELGDVTRIAYSSTSKQYTLLETSILDFEDREKYTYGNWWSDGKVATDIVSSGEKSFYKYWSNRFPSHNFVFFQPVDGSYFDLSDADTLAIDLYIDNIDNWNLVYKERAGVEFQANGTNTEYKYINIPQGLKQGWNTIEIELNSLGLELSNITGIRITPMMCSNWGSDGVPPLNMISGTYDESVANVSIRIDNIRKIKRLERCILDEYSEFMIGKNGEAIVIFDSIDISAVRKFELDVNVPANVTEFTIMLFDSDGGQRKFTFSGLVEGNNRLSVRISDYVTDNGLNLENITGYTVISATDTKLIVKDFVAEDFIDYDVNEDYVVDISDLVRAKKISAETPTFGNTVAIPGGGCIINSYAITLLRRYLLLAL